MAKVEAKVSADLVRAILEAVCERDGIPLESSVDPGKPARNYELALRLKIGRVFVLGDASGSPAVRLAHECEHQASNFTPCRICGA